MKSFEVIRNEKPVFITHHVDCIPSQEALKVLQNAGYKFRIDGKKVPLAKVGETIKNVNSKKAKK